MLLVHRVIQHSDLGERIDVMKRSTMTSAEERTVLKASDVQQLRAGMDGYLIVQGDAQYDRSRALWNGMIDRCPLVMARCHSVKDVQNCIHFARNQGLRISVRGGGHNVAGYAVCEGGLVVDLSEMRKVEADDKGRMVYIQGGATLGDVDRATYPYGLATPMGVVTETGYAGLTLHGGMGWMLRKYGLATDNVVGMDIVTADERVLKANAEDHPDLFWGLHGGGGSFGVVTSFQSRLYPIPRELLFAVPIFSMDQAGYVLRFLRDYMPQAPEELMTMAAFWTIPAKPEFPGALHGRHALFVLVCYLGDPETGEKIVEPLRTCAPTMVDLTFRSDWLTIQKFFDEEYPNGRRYYWKSTFANDMPDSVIDALIQHTVTRPSMLTSIDIWFLGGAYGRVDRAATAFGDRSAPYLINYEANWDKPENDQMNVQWTRESLAQTQSLTQARTYLNFPGQGEEGEALLKGAFGENYARLQSVKKMYDPENFFRGHLIVTPK
jgi:FAD/FMN-containing dehydrogenase